MQDSSGLGAPGSPVASGCFSCAAGGARRPWRRKLGSGPLPLSTLVPLDCLLELYVCLFLMEIFR